MTYHHHLRPPIYTPVKTEPIKRDQETWRGRVKGEQTLDIFEERWMKEGEVAKEDNKRGNCLKK
jgi:hypothetical protein